MMRMNVPDDCNNFLLPPHSLHNILLSTLNYISTVASTIRKSAVPPFSTAKCDAGASAARSDVPNWRIDSYYFQSNLSLAPVLL